MRLGLFSAPHAVVCTGGPGFPVSVAVEGCRYGLPVRVAGTGRRYGQAVAGTGWRYGLRVLFVGLSFSFSEVPCYLSQLGQWRCPRGLAMNESS
jgi:hypothetical protein